MSASSARTVAMTSSITLTTGLPIPAVVIVTTGRPVAFIAWTPPALRRPRTAASTGCSVPAPLLDRKRIAPAAGRTRVLIASLTWSTPGILSAKTSMASRSTRTAMPTLLDSASYGEFSCA